MFVGTPKRKVNSVNICFGEGEGIESFRSSRKMRNIGEIRRRIKMINSRRIFQIWGSCRIWSRFGRRCCGG